MRVCSGQVLVLEFHLPDVCWDGHLSFLLLYVSREWSRMTSDAFSGQSLPPYIPRRTWKSSCEFLYIIAPRGFMFSSQPLSSLCRSDYGRISFIGVWQSRSPLTEQVLLCQFRCQVNWLLYRLRLEWAQENLHLLTGWQQYCFQLSMCRVEDGRIPYSSLGFESLFHYALV